MLRPIAHGGWRIAGQGGESHRYQLRQKLLVVHQPATASGWLNYLLQAAD